MNKKEKIKLITDLVSHYESITKNINGILNYTGGDYESPLPNSVFKAVDSYIDLVEKSCGYKDGWISWFIFENNCGKAEHVCNYEGVGCKISSVKDLVEFLEMIGD